MYSNMMVILLKIGDVEMHFNIMLVGSVEVEPAQFLFLVLCIICREEDVTRQNANCGSSSIITILMESWR